MIDLIPEKRKSLIAIANKIAKNKEESPAGKLKSLSKLFVQEKRDWSQKPYPRIGWKWGELVELAEAIIKLDLTEVKKEWGDIGYYLAQSFGLLWWLYAIITPESIINQSIKKMDKRSKKK